MSPIRHAGRRSDVISRAANCGIYSDIDFFHRTPPLRRVRFTILEVDDKSQLQEILYPYM